MNERRWERLGAGFGAAFAILLLASYFAAPTPPHIDDSAAEISAYFSDNRIQVLTGAMLGTLAAVALLLFVGHLRHVLARAERGTEAVGPVMMASGIALAAIGIVLMLPNAVLALSAGQGIALEPGVTQAVFLMGSLCGGAAAIIAALFVGVTSFAMIRHELMEPWLGWVGMAVAVLLATVGIASFYLGSYESAWVAAGVIGFVAFAIWTFAASVMMMLEPEESKAAERRAILQPTA